MGYMYVFKKIFGNVKTLLYLCCMNYLDLAKEQFYNLKEETLDEDRHVLGAENEIDYFEEGIKFKIKVDGFWEKATWFNWEVIDEKGNIIDSGTEY